MDRPRAHCTWQHRPSGMGALVLLAALTAATAADRSRPTMTVVINTSHVTHTIPAPMNGGHFSPLNHQVQVLLSNLL